MINEGFNTSNAVVNKTLINKVCGTLRNTKGKGGFAKITLNFGINKDFYGIDKVHSAVRYKIDKFIVEDTTDNTYIMCNFKASFNPEEFEAHGSAKWNLDRDQRLSPIVKSKSYGNIVAILAVALLGGYGDAVKDAVHKDFYGGSKKNTDILQLSESEFKNSVAYKKIKGFLDDVASSNLQCKLSDGIYKRIKSRTNSIPVCWISNKDNMFVYIASNNRGNYASETKITSGCLIKAYIPHISSGFEPLPSNWTDRIDWLHWVAPEKSTMNNVVDYWDY